MRNFILGSIIPLLFFIFFLLTSYGDSRRKKNPDSYVIDLRLPKLIRKLLHPFGNNPYVPLHVFINSIICLLCGLVFLGINFWNFFFSQVNLIRQRQFYKVFIPVIFSVYMIGMFANFCVVLVCSIMKREFVAFSFIALIFCIIVLIMLLVYICFSMPILITLLN